MYDILLKGARVIDPFQNMDGVRDIAIAGDRIVALEKSISPLTAKKIVTLNGKIVTPGLIDIHCHPAFGIGGNAVPPDVAGINAGVLLICDAGTTGPINFIVLRDFIRPHSKTSMVYFLNIALTGLIKIPEIERLADIDAKAVLKIVEENRLDIRGIKVRAMEAARGMERNVVKVAKEIADEVHLPLMVHLGEFRERRKDDPMDVFGRESVAVLTEGDIISHYMTERPGGMVLPNGDIFKELTEAKKRGVLLDSSHGKNNFSFMVARILMEKGLTPDVISTDLCETAYSTVQSLLVTMSKFLSLGMDLADIVAATTIRPARALGLDNAWGTLSVGRNANISVLESTDGDYWFFDGNAGNSIQANTLLEPRMVLREGVIMPCQSHYHIDAEYVKKTMIP